MAFSNNIYSDVFVHNAHTKYCRQVFKMHPVDVRVRSQLCEEPAQALKERTVGLRQARHQATQQCMAHVNIALTCRSSPLSTKIACYSTSVLYSIGWHHSGFSRKSNKD